MQIFIFGNAETGKQSIVLRYYHDRFIEETVSLFHEDAFQKKIIFEEKEIIVESIVSAKEKPYSDYSPAVASASDCLFFVYSIDSEDSFNQIPSHYQILKGGFNDLQKFELIPKFLIANKIDLKDQRKILFEKGLHFAKKNGMHFIEVSAKTDENIQLLFEKAVAEVIKTRDPLFPFLKTFQQEMIQFFERKEFTDFSFHFENTNEEPIPLHSLILKYRLGNDFEPKLQILKNSEKDDVIQFLKCVYSGLERFYSSKTLELSQKSGIEIKIGRENLIEDMKKLDLDQQSKDFEIVVKNRKIKVHKIILALRSEVYREMFNKVKDDSGKVKDYTNSKFSSIQTLIQFFYTDTIEEAISMETIEELKEAQDFYQLNPQSSLSVQLKYFEKKKKEQKGNKCLIF
ncbi:ras di-ras and rheb family members of small gtpase superfamily [Anaeramoeba ignava]|uniref:Ras di-ras and rheb family members of small gtpase superfamily n=1 Tax=Anaeramoeba ignava TaxID=1746090 RepID=A0A9Q0LJU3_ANAIG|nr:ras di-ras and rheb family members of small gtpase superfamily [Anaeramoeba ignava]